MAAQTLSPHPLAHGFVELDDRVLGGNPGIILVIAPTVEIAEAAGAHVARRAAVRGLAFLHTRSRAGSPLFREVQAELGLTCSCDVSASANEIAQIAATLIVSLPRAGTWDRAVLHDVVRAMVANPASPAATPGTPPRSFSHPDSHSRQGLLLVLLSVDGDTASGLAGFPDLPETRGDLELESFDVGEKMGAEARRRWFAAVAERACVDVGVEDLATLDSSFAGLRHHMGDPDGAPPSNVPTRWLRIASLIDLSEPQPLEMDKEWVTLRAT